MSRFEVKVIRRGKISVTIELPFVVRTDKEGFIWGSIEGKTILNGMAENEDGETIYFPNADAAEKSVSKTVCSELAEQLCISPRSVKARVTR